MTYMASHSGVEYARFNNFDLYKHHYEISCLRRDVRYDQASLHRSAEHMGPGTLIGLGPNMPMTLKRSIMVCLKASVLVSLKSGMLVSLKSGTPLLKP